MGALPKNKITRVERGKRRAGNKPTVTKDVNRASVPLHKRGMVAEFLKVMGVTTEKPATKKTEKPTVKKPTIQPVETIKKSAPTKAVKPTAKKSAASRKSGTR